MTNGNGNGNGPRPEPGSGDPENKPIRPRNYTGLILVSLICLVCILVFQNTLKDPTKINFTRFMDHLVRGEVKSVKVEKKLLTVELIKGVREEGRVRVVVPETWTTTNALLLEELGEFGRLVAPEEDSFQAQDHLAALVAKRDEGGATGTIARDFYVERRILIPSDEKNQMLVLIGWTDPATAKNISGAQTFRSHVYMFEPVGTESDDESAADPRQPITWSDLLWVTNTVTENEGLGLAAPEDVTRVLPLGDGTLGFSEDDGLFQTIILSLAPWVVILLFFWFFVFRQMRNNGIGGNVLSFGKSRARLHSREKINTTFEDVAGIDEAKDEVTEVVEFLRHPGRFSRLGGRIPRGVMLVGPPGTGKTLLAKAIAGEAEVPFFSISGSDFVEMFVGVGASRVRDLFRQAKESSPCIIFLDEIDAVGRRRGAGLGGGHDEREQTLNAILVEMDGFDSDTGVIVVAATNRIDVLDPALLRPGRFDRQIRVDLPDQSGRAAILRVHARKSKLHSSVDIDKIARATPGFSGAELEALINEAAIIAALAKKDAIFEEDLEEARDRVRWGRAKTSRILTEEDRRITAYHEAGHTLVALLNPNAQPIHKVTIVPRGPALGVTMYLPEKDQFSLSRSQMEAHLQVCFGGRIAEDLFFEDVTSGASDDIKQATNLARSMVRELGMSDVVGPINYSENEDTVFLGRDINRSQKMSEATADAIDQEVKRVIDEAYGSAEQALQDNRDKLELLAENLLQHEMLSREEIDALLGGESVDDYRARTRPAPVAEAPAERPSNDATHYPESSEPGLPPGLAGEGVS